MSEERVDKLAHAMFRVMGDNWSKKPVVGLEPYAAALIASEAVLRKLVDARTCLCWLQEQVPCVYCQGRAAVAQLRELPGLKVED